MMTLNNTNYNNNKENTYNRQNTYRKREKKPKYLPVQFFLP